ncbi:hypothetical protein HMI56_004774 [Coelomomyces lativittatus]|nr:hypothetical protein HMI56_004774 [Coelomomyces lativittatus]
MLSIQLKVLIQATEHVKHMAWHPTRKHVLVFCTGTETLHFWQGTQAPPSSNPPKGMNTTTTHTDPHLYSGKSAPSSYVPSQPMDNEPMDEIDEPHDGMAMCVNVPATDFHINTFRWSQDGKKMILLDKSRFCIAFEVEEML